jgi:hypothetical protein
MICSHTFRPFPLAHFSYRVCQFLARLEIVAGRASSLLCGGLGTVREEDGIVKSRHGLQTRLYPVILWDV